MRRSAARLQLRRQSVRPGQSLRTQRKARMGPTCNRLCLWRPRMGRIHPLFGIYPKRVLLFAEELIREGDYRIMHFLERAGYRTLELEPESHAMENINSTEEYRRLVETQNAGENPYTAAHPFVFAISGYKNSGKTTLITRLIPELTGRGYKVAVIKHDGHDFKSDVPGTDSYRHQKAGAYGTAVFSKNRFLITKECHGITERDLVFRLSGGRHHPDRGIKKQQLSEIFLRVSGKTAAGCSRTGRRNGEDHAADCTCIIFRLKNYFLDSSKWQITHSYIRIPVAYVKITKNRQNFTSFC